MPRYLSQLVRYQTNPGSLDSLLHHKGGKGQCVDAACACPHTHTHTLCSLALLSWLLCLQTLHGFEALFTLQNPAKRQTPPSFSSHPARNHPRILLWKRYFLSLSITLSGPLLILLQIYYNQFVCWLCVGMAGSASRRETMYALFIQEGVTGTRSAECASYVWGPVLGSGEHNEEREGTVRTCRCKNAFMHAQTRICRTTPIYHFSKS